MPARPGQGPGFIGRPAPPPPLYGYGRAPRPPAHGAMDFFRLVADAFPLELLGKLAQASSGFRAACRERLRREGSERPCVRLDLLASVEEVDWALGCMEIPDPYAPGGAWYDRGIFALSLGLGRSGDLALLDRAWAVAGDQLCLDLVTLAAARAGRLAAMAWADDRRLESFESPVPDSEVVAEIYRIVSLDLDRLFGVGAHAASRYGIICSFAPRNGPEALAKKRLERFDPLLAQYPDPDDEDVEDYSDLLAEIRRDLSAAFQEADDVPHEDEDD